MISVVMGKRGRPRLLWEQRRTKQFNLRLRADEYAMLAAAAVKSGRSITDEVRDRLRLTFELEKKGVGDVEGSR